MGRNNQVIYTSLIDSSYILQIHFNANDDCHWDVYCKFLQISVGITVPICSETCITITYAGSLPHTDLTIPKMQYKCAIVQHFYPYHAHGTEALCGLANSTVI